MLTACSGSSPLPQNASTIAPAALSQRSLRGDAAGQMLAVGSCYQCGTDQNGPSAEVFFKVGSEREQRHVTAGLAAPWVGAAFDASGDLFVANCMECWGMQGTNDVVEIPRGARRPSLKITDGVTDPYALALDASGTLYVSNPCWSSGSPCQVSEYAPGYTSGPPTTTISVQSPTALAFDKHGNLYVANCAVCATGTTGSDQILVYAPGGTSPIRTITAGLNEPLAMAFDSKDNLYVANCINCDLGSGFDLHGTDTVTEYSQGKTLTKTITLGTNEPFSLAVNQSNDLFVGNYAVNTVTEYQPGASSSSVTISRGIKEPDSLGFDASGTLYVANGGANTVTEYATGYTKGKPEATLSVAFPSTIAISR